MFAMSWLHAVADETAVEDEPFHGQSNAEEKAGKELKRSSFRENGEVKHTENYGNLHGAGYHLIPTGGTAVSVVRNETCHHKEEREPPTNEFEPNKRANKILSQTQ